MELQSILPEKTYDILQRLRLFVNTRKLMIEECDRNIKEYLSQIERLPFVELSVDRNANNIKKEANRKTCILDELRCANLERQKYEYIYRAELDESCSGKIPVWRG